MRALETRRRGPITRADWMRAGLEAFARWQAPQLVLEVDGERVDGAFGQVLVSNIVHYAGFAVLDRGRRLDDGLFEVYAFECRSRARLARHLLHGVLGRFPAAGVTMRRARRVVVTCETPVPFEIDGDFRGRTPFELAVGSQPFRILVPSDAPATGARTR